LLVGDTQCSSTVELFAGLLALNRTGQLRNHRNAGCHSSTMEPAQGMALIGQG
jgi:hypothetical protein